MRGWGARTIVATLTWLAIGAGGASAEQLTVYSSLPLVGSDRDVYEDIVRGAQTALDEVGGVAGPHTVRLVSLNDASRRFGAWDPVVVSRNARRAARDDSTIAYLGEFNSGASAISLPILNEADILQISPSNTYTGLTRRAGANRGEPVKYYPTGLRTYGRVAAADHLQAAAIAALLDRRGARRVFLVDDAEVYGAGLGRMVRARLRGRGIGVAGRVRLGRPVPVARRVARARADAMVYTGITANGAVRLWRAVHARRPRLALVGSDGVAEAGFARRIGRSAARRTSLTLGTLPVSALPGAQPLADAFRARFGREPSPYMPYGYEAMRVVLDCVRAGVPAPTLRRGAIECFFAIRDRESVLGRYSIDRFGDTTLSRFGVYGVEGGRLTFREAVDSSRRRSGR
jgi:branched-chain amino acid transport system substrate-binding protein